MILAFFKEIILVNLVICLENTLNEKIHLTKLISYYNCTLNQNATKKLLFWNFSLTLNTKLCFHFIFMIRNISLLITEFEVLIVKALEF